MLFIMRLSQLNPKLNKTRQEFPLTWIWQSTVGDNFSDQYAKRPNIRFNCEPIIIGRLGRRPFDREPSSDPGFVLIILVAKIVQMKIFKINSSIHILVGNIILHLGIEPPLKMCFERLLHTHTTIGCSWIMWCHLAYSTDINTILYNIS